MPRYAREWEEWAARDPYFAVLTADQFRTPNLSQDALDSFFASGASYVDFLLSIIRSRFESSFAPASVLEFGCGVGRLAIPFARTGAEVVGVDISAAMLAEARRNADRFGIANLRFVDADEFAPSSFPPFDLVNSYITFQHVPRHEGEVFYERLLASVRPGGFVAIHFLHTAPGAAWRRIAARFRGTIPGVNAIANLLLGRPVSTPYMQMNPYDMNRLMHHLQAHGYGQALSVFTDHGGFEGILVVAQRAPQQVP